MVSQTLSVPKSFHGKVIGKQRATLLDIESDYGVKVTMPGRDSGSEVVSIEGPTLASVNAAVARIKDICGMGTENDRSALDKKRAEVDQAFATAKATANGPMRDAAYLRANALKSECERLQWDQARRIFAEKNQGYGLDQMDLHGLSVAEAEYFVKDRLGKVESKFSSSPPFVLTIITGFGHHSDGGVAKVKPAIISLLSERQYTYTLDDAGGLILVSGSQGGPAPTTRAPPPPGSAEQQSPAARELTFIWEVIQDLFLCCFNPRK